MTSSSRVVIAAAAMVRGSSPRRPRLRHLATALACFAMAGCGTTGGGAAPDSDATLVLDGPWAGVDAGIASATARGYDEAEGVHLRVREGPVSPRALTDGRADFAVLDLNDLAGRRGLVAVLAIVQQPLLASTAGAGALRTPWARRLSRVVGH